MHLLSKAHSFVLALRYVSRIRATAERSSFVLPNTEPTRRYDEPDELPSVAVVLAHRR